ncbi:MAG: redoxin family protein [Sphingomonas sp.]
MRALIACLLVLPLTIGGCDKQSRQAEQAQAPQPTANAAAATSDEVTSDELPANAAAPAVALPGTIDRSHKGVAAPTVSFTSPTGKTVTLADFRGRPVLLNLWATWCAPCVKEMPTLDALAAQEGGTLTVLTVSQDVDGAAKAAPFFKAHGLQHLKPYTDPKLALSSVLSANLPITILYDATGHEVWREMGGYDWSSAQAKALVAQAGSR